MKEVFNGPHAVAVRADNLLGILSLIFWALTITVSLKYAMFITRADNRGEGGIMALTSLALRSQGAGPRMLWLMSILGIFGAGLFYGHAVITPAMSVLSAVEGLEVATPVFKPYIVPISIGVLCGLFIFQPRGTASVGALFGPVMLFWFGTLGVLGLWNILKHADVIAAINPWYALRLKRDKVEDMKRGRTEPRSTVLPEAAAAMVVAVRRHILLPPDDPACMRCSRPSGEANRRPR